MITSIHLGNIRQGVIHPVCLIAGLGIVCVYKRTMSLLILWYIICKYEPLSTGRTS